MKGFIHEDFLLTTEAARRLFPEKRARQLLDRSGELLGTPGKEVNV